MKRLLTIAITATLFLPTACGKQQKVRDRVLGYLAATERLSRSFVYTEDTGGKRVVVAGKVEDNFRYQEIVRFSGTDVLEQIVDDDTAAVKVLAPDKIPLFASGALLPDSPVLTDTLRNGEWVIDPSGAPSLKKKVPDPEAFVVSDPLRDPIQVMEYIRTCILKSIDVKLFRVEDITPAYRASEDNFPKDDLRKGIKRYDLVRPALPNLLRPPGAGQGQQEPQTANFRKMAIYVKAGLIVKVLEDIDIDHHPDVKEAVAKHKTRVINLIKAVKAGRTREKIKLRQMSVSFTDLGKKVSVRKPPNGLIASLKSFTGQDSATGNIFGYGLPPASTGTVPGALPSPAPAASTSP